VPFSHQHHVSDVGIDCRYCHQSVEVSARAGLPTTEVCMNCHRQLWNQSDVLAPVRNSFRKDEPLRWNRVHDLPDYVYFNHSIHIHKGIGCYSCHGDVGEMALMRRAEPLTMQWCLNCHRDPQQHVRPRELVFDPEPLEQLLASRSLELAREEGPQEPADQTNNETKHAPTTRLVSDMVSLRHQLPEEYHLKSRTDCYTCHR